MMLASFLASVLDFSGRLPACRLRSEAEQDARRRRLPACRLRSEAEQDARRAPPPFAEPNRPHTPKPACSPQPRSAVKCPQTLKKRKETQHVKKKNNRRKLENEQNPK